MKNLAFSIMIISTICAVLGTAGSIIYFIYEWAASEEGFKYALWEAAKLWIMLVPGGGVVFLCSYLWHELLPSK